MKKRLIVGLKSIDPVPALDYYLTQLDNSLTPIKNNTILRAHFSKKKNGFGRKAKASVSKEDFEFLRVIGRGGYSKVVLARKKDSGRMYAIKVMKKADVFSRAKISLFTSEVKINSSVKDSSFIVDLYYAFQTDDELYLVMDL